MSLYLQEWPQQITNFWRQGNIGTLHFLKRMSTLPSLTKEDVKEQLSILCRKRDASNFAGYITSRKKAKKVIQKLLKYLKSIDSKDAVLALDKDHETATTFNMLKEVEAVTLVVLESLLSYTAGTKVQARGSGWSLVSKMMHHKSAAVHAKEIVTSEFEKVDTTGQALISHKPSKCDDNKNIENVQNQLGELE
ncbi:uncharacterized protein LOC130793458 isoform X2 [Actinidia eriantha]|uniref:uncharacterized protein LOC130793458 isoform X2 n=1 Tax=Actinidia eriantha TaxID=165200 RepID=UPI002585C57C|nr:uncharacterized protein LOC130793458 isoform X2 [Actinidia eriantha]